MRLAGASGFSLIEALVSTSLLATAVVTLAQLVAVSTRAGVSSRQATYATALAQQKLEELRTVPWDALLPSADEVGRSYVRRWSMERLPARPRAVVIEVVVTPRDGLGETRLVTVRTRRSP